MNKQFTQLPLSFPKLTNESLRNSTKIYDTIVRDGYAVFHIRFYYTKNCRQIIQFLELHLLNIRLYNLNSALGDSCGLGFLAKDDKIDLYRLVFSLLKMFENLSHTCVCACISSTDKSKIYLVTNVYIAMRIMFNFKTHR